MQVKGKTVFFLGSSITYGSGANGISFADITSEMCGFKMIKEALSGTTLADINKDSYVSRLKARTINEKVDLFVCQLSTNDPWLKVDINKTEEAIRFIIDYVNKNFGCPICFYTNTYYGNAPYEEHIKMLYKLKEEYGFKVLDLYNNEAATTQNAKHKDTYLKPDGVHPTFEGYKELWAPLFIEFYKTI